MQYSEGSIGRVFILRMDDGEDLLESIQKVVKEKCVESWMMLFLGAMKDGRAVTDPEKPVIPPVPHFETFQSAWEVFGMAQSINRKLVQRFACTAEWAERRLLWLAVSGIKLRFIS